MEEIFGGYTQVELRDGREGNYQVAQKYFRDFSRLEREFPAGFKKLCARVMANPALELTEEHKGILVDVGLAYRRSEDAKQFTNDPRPFDLAKPEDEIKDFLVLTVIQKPLSSLRAFFSTSADVDYKLVTPFMYPKSGYPDEVADGKKACVILEWAGQDSRDYPGDKLVPYPKESPAFKNRPEYDIPVPPMVP